MSQEQIWLKEKEWRMKIPAWTHHLNISQLQLVVNLHGAQLICLKFSKCSKFKRLLWHSNLDYWNVFIMNWIKSVWNEITLILFDGRSPRPDVKY